MPGEEAAVNVQVAVRCRPVNEEEKKSGQAQVISCNPGKRTCDVSYGVGSKKQTKTYSFDKVFGAYSTQEEVFDTMVSPIVQECLAGFNCTIFAYGQTGTGKTHTMEGDIHHEDMAGIVPRSIRAIFETLTNGGAEFTVRVSFLELYNEELQDLLVPGGSGEAKKLKLMEVEKKGVVVQNLEEVTVLNSNDIFEILQRGIQQRATAATNMNKNSSRSHSIFTMKIMIKECNVDGEEVVRHGQLNLVDLAGSECVGRSGAKNDRAREAGNINQSLLTLGRVITALVDHHGHVPYRDSKLTRLLQESLGGKAKTCIIATLSPSQLAVEETMSTLDYAHKAKNIKNQPLVNQKMTKKTVLKEYCEEIETLRAQLQITREKNGVWVEPEKFFAMEQRIASQEAQISEVESVLKSRQEDFKAIKAEKEEIEAKVGGLESDLSATKERLEQATRHLSEANAKLTQAEDEISVNQKIITEQGIAETNLLKEGEVVQGELTVQRNARDLLLSKVDALNARDGQRIEETNKFVHVLLENGAGLCDIIDGMAAASDESSTHLCSGVSKLLTKGKITCTELSACIDEALCELDQSTVRATDSMKGSCDALSSDLDGTNKRVVTALTDLKAQLSSWLGEVDKNIKMTLALSSEQEAASAVLSNEMDNSRNQLHEMRAKAVEAEAARAQENVTEHMMLKEAVVTALESYQAELARTINKSNEDLAAQAKHIEATVGKALAKMLGDAIATNDSLCKEASSFSEETQGLVARSVSSLAHVGEVQAKHHLSCLNNIVDASNNQMESVSSTMCSIGTKRKEVEGLVGHVSGAVATKKAKLDDTTTNLVSEIDSAVEGAKAAIGKTSDTASTLLLDVQKANVNMQKSASASMGTFSSFMDGHGQEVCDGVESHFNVLSSSLAGAKRGIASMSSSSNEFRDGLDIYAVKSSGNTPTKQAFVPLADLSEFMCRPHEAIREEHARAKVAIEQTIAPESMVPDTEEDEHVTKTIDGENEAVEGEGLMERGGCETTNEEKAPSSPRGRRSAGSRQASNDEENVVNVETSSRCRSRSRSKQAVGKGKGASGIQALSATRGSRALK